MTKNGNWRGDIVAYQVVLSDYLHECVG